MQKEIDKLSLEELIQCHQEFKELNKNGCIGDSLIRSILLKEKKKVNLLDFMGLQNKISERLIDVLLDKSV